MIKLGQCLIEMSLSEALVLIQFHQSACILLSSTIEYSYSGRGHHSGTSLCFYFIYAGKLYGGTHRKITRRWKSTVSYIWTTTRREPRNYADFWLESFSLTPAGVFENFRLFPDKLARY